MPELITTCPKCNAQYAWNSDFQEYPDCPQCGHNQVKINRAKWQQCCRSVECGDAGAVQGFLYDPDVKRNINAGPWTMLHLAVFGDRADIVRLLLTNGADPNAAYDQTGRDTPLHSAVCRARLEIAQMLLDAGARADIKSAAGKTPLDYAQDADDCGMVELLQRHASGAVCTGAEAKAAQEAVGIRRPTRPIEFSCSCGRQFSVPAQHAGKKGKCPSCGRTLTVPSEQSSAGPGSPQLGGLAPEEAAKSTMVPPPPPAAEASPTRTARPGIVGWVILAVFAMSLVALPCCAILADYLVRARDLEPGDAEYDTTMAFTMLPALALMALAGIVTGFICRARRRRYDAVHPPPALLPDNAGPMARGLEVSHDPGVTVISGSVESWSEELSKADAEFGEMFYQCPQCRYSIRINDIGKLMLKTRVETFKSQFGQKTCKRCGQVFVAYDHVKKGRCPDFDYAADTQRGPTPSAPA